MFIPSVSHLECFERDKKRYQSDISFLCPVINLIKAQVCDKDSICYSHCPCNELLDFVTLKHVRNFFSKTEIALNFKTREYHNI